jgi:hypothetical protein
MHLILLLDQLMSEDLQLNLHLPDAEVQVRPRASL